MAALDARSVVGLAEILPREEEEEGGDEEGLLGVVAWDPTPDDVDLSGQLLELILV